MSNPGPSSGSRDIWDIALVASTLAFDPEAATGTWHGAITASSYTGGVLENTSNAVGDSISFNVPLGAGRWNVSFALAVTASGGQFSVAVDGNVVGTIDTYAAATAYGTERMLSFDVPSDGNHVVTLTVTGRNASATGQTLFLQTIHFRRTA